MPDYERLFDKLAIDMAANPEDKAYAIGHAKGKTAARRQVVWCALIFATIAVIVKGWLAV